MTVEIKLLQAAIEHTAYLINREIKQLPADFVPFWEMISEGPAIVEGIQAREEFLYDLVRGAAEEYDKAKKIGFDNAFSTIIDAIGIKARSEGWYRVMAYHYQKQADRVEISDEIFASLIDRVVEVRGQQLQAEAERLNADPAAAVPEELRLRVMHAISQAFDEKEKP